MARKRLLRRKVLTIGHRTRPIPDYHPWYRSPHGTTTLCGTSVYSPLLTRLAFKQVVARSSRARLISQPAVVLRTFRPSPLWCRPPQRKVFTLFAESLRSRGPRPPRRGFCHPLCTVNVEFTVPKNAQIEFPTLVKWRPVGTMAWLARVLKGATHAECGETAHDQGTESYAMVGQRHRPRERA